jgi:hypothetical protein
VREQAAEGSFGRAPVILDIVRRSSDLKSPGRAASVMGAMLLPNMNAPSPMLVPSLFLVASRAQRAQVDASTLPDSPSW